MSGKYCILCILVMLSLRSDAACPPRMAEKPQLSATFLQGQWYEHLFYNTVLNDNACSHFDIQCDNTSSCTIEHVIWESYLLKGIWNGTIKENDTTVELAIKKNETSNVYDVNLVFKKDAVLIWACNLKDNTPEFASVLIRMDSDDEMENVWTEASKNMNFLSITEGFPAGIWNKIDPKKCTSSGNTIYQWSYSSLLPVALFLMIFIQKIEM